MVTGSSDLAGAESAAGERSASLVVELPPWPHLLPMQVVRRTWDWLAEQPEDAAELALLLFEAAPKLNFGEAGPSRAALAKMPRRTSVQAQGGFRRRLARAVPIAPGGTLTAPPFGLLASFTLGHTVQALLLCAVRSHWARGRPLMS